MRLCEAESKRREVEYLVLHASHMGRPVYEKLGWVAKAEMGKMI